jgi:hypothetical protein
MKLDCILTACNTNELYLDFIPIFIKAWNKLYPDIDVKIVLINDIIPTKFEAYKDNIILFKPIPNISTAFTSQYIRLLYPCILKQYKNGIMITDMDIIPMNRTYYTKNIENIDNNKFIYLRDVCLNDYKQIAMCYNVGLSSTWANIFNINTIEDINQRLIDVYKNINYVDGHGKSGWGTDQIDFYNYVMNWNKSTNHFVILNDRNTGYNRLDRNTFSLDNNTSNLIKNGFYSDYHCFRPYNKYQIINDKVVELL